MGLIEIRIDIDFGSEGGGQNKKELKPTTYYPPLTTKILLYLVSILKII